MADQRLKDLRGTGRRDFLRWSATVAACLGLERARFLNVLNDTAGTAAADTAACASTLRHIHVRDGQGGLSNWTLIFPFPSVMQTANAQYSHYASGQGVAAQGYDKTYLYGPHSPWQAEPKWKVSAFVAGRSETHTAAPVSVSTLGGNSSLAAAAAIQQANPTLLPVLQVGGINYGTAAGAPAPAAVGSAADLVGLFNSAASRTLMQAPENGALAESYYKAFLGLNSSAGRSTIAKQYGIGKVSMNLLSRNLAAQLTPTAADEALFGLAGGTPGAVQNMSRAMITTIRAFSLGLSSMLIMRGFNNDPHQMFSGGDALATTTATAMQRMMDGLYAFAKSKQDPACSSKTLADSLVFSVDGDTYKNPFARAGWGDGTPQNSNMLYVMGAGHLKTGFFGSVERNGNNSVVQGWDPATGNTGGAYDQALGAPAAAALLFAVAKGDMRRVRDFYSGPAIDGVVNLNVTG